MTPPISILHLITDLDVGGAEVMLRNVVRKMDRSRFVNHVVSLTDHGALVGELRAAGIAVSSLGLRRGVPDPRALTRLAKIMREQRPTILQTWLYHADLLGTVSSFFTRVPLVWNIRCSVMDMSQYGVSSRVVRRLLSWLSGMPSAVVVNSFAGRDYHRSLGYHPKDWVLLPNGFDVERFHRAPNAAQEVRAELGLSNVPLIGTIGRFDPMKDYATFLDAAAIVAKSSDAHFLMAGLGLESTNSWLTNALKDRGLTERVSLLGQRSDTEKIDAALDVFCLSSIGEGFPNALGEAMACETPCVTTDVGDCALVLGGTGSVVPPQNAAEMSRAILDLLSRTEEERRALGRAARQRILDHYSLDAIVRRYEELYERLIPSRRVFLEAPTS